MTKLYYAAAILTTGIFVALWLIRRPRALIQPGSLHFPVLLVNADKGAEVCLDVDELTTRPEDQEYTIEKNFQVIDASGARYRIENYKVIEKKPSTLNRIFKATIYSRLRFKATFDLRPHGQLTRIEIIDKLDDATWEIPDASPPPMLADLYVAYRNNRYLMSAHSSVPAAPDEPASHP